MIELNLQELAAWVLGLSMVVVAVLFLRERRRAAKNERRAIRGRVVCRLCLAVFEAPSRDPVQRCPECHGSTERSGPRPLG